MNDNRDRTKRITPDRRQYHYAIHIPERRCGSDRRKSHQ